MANDRQELRLKKDPLHLMNNKCSTEGEAALGCSGEANAQLITEGWQKRYVADQRMAKEAVETYSAMGYEVRLESLQTDQIAEACMGCKTMLDQFSVIYTRKNLDK